MVLWRPTRPSRTNTQKRCLFHYRGLECKSRKSRNTWSNRQIWPWSTEYSRAEANRILPRECLVRANTLFQHQRRLYTWTSPDGQHRNQTDYILCSQRCSNYHTIALISHASKVMLKIFQARLQQYVNHELPDILETAEEPEIKLPTSNGSLKKPENSRKHIFLLYWLCQSLWLCGSQ